MPLPRREDHAVIIPSMGRSEVLRDTLASISRQTSIPALVVLVVTTAADLPQGELMPGVEAIITDKGSSVQRNAGLRHLPAGMKFVSFLDDDVELEPEYFERILCFLTRHETYVLVDGAVVRNGDVTREQALMLIGSIGTVESGFHDSLNAYGCNMTVRREVADKVLFDERLKLYAWLEDADFSRRCLHYGNCAQVSDARLVHLCAPAGRMNGKRYGFAQITNSYYLRTKGQMSLIGLLRTHWGPALCSNIIGTLCRDRKVDRAGRLRGNLIALKRIFFGRCEPEYVERIGN